MKPEDLREERIRELLETCKNERPDTIDSILATARKMYPFVRLETLRSYAVAVIHLLNDDALRKGYCDW